MSFCFWSKPPLFSFKKFVVGGLAVLVCSMFRFELLAHDGWGMASGQPRRLGFFNKGESGYEIHLSEVRPSHMRESDRLASGSGWSMAGNYHFGLSDPKSLGLFSGKVTSGVLMHGDRLFFGVDENLFYCISEGDHKVIWSFDLKSECRGEPLARGELVYVPSMDGHLRALSLENGALIWEIDFDAPLLASPAIIWGKLVQVDSQGHLSAFDIKNDHKELWSIKLPAGVTGTPVGYAARVFVGTVEGHLFCFDAGTGKPHWQKSLNGAIVSGMALHPATEHSPSWLAVGTALGQLHWMSLAGEEWSASPLVLDSSLLTPAVGGGALYVPSEKIFYQIDPYHGTRVAEFLLPQGVFFRSPIFDGQAIWVHSIIEKKGAPKDGASYKFSLRPSSLGSKSKVSVLSTFEDVDIDGDFKESFYEKPWFKINWHANDVKTEMASGLFVASSATELLLALKTPIQKLGRGRREKYQWNMSLWSAGNVQLRVSGNVGQVVARSVKASTEPIPLKVIWQKTQSAKTVKWECLVSGIEGLADENTESQKELSFTMERTQWKEGHDVHPSCEHHLASFKNGKRTVPIIISAKGKK